MVKGWKLFNAAKNKHQQQFQASGKAINAKVRLFGRIGQALIEAKQAGRDPFAAIESLVKQEIPRAPLPEGLDLASAGSDRPPREDRGPRSRSRDGERGGRGRDRGDRKPRAEAATEAAPQPVAETVEPAPEERREERRAEPREDRRSGRDRREGERREPGRDRDAGREASRDAGRDGGRDDRRYPRDRRDDGPSVVGLGDHMPDFLTRSFALKPAPAAEAEAADEAPATAEGEN